MLQQLGDDIYGERALVRRNASRCPEELPALHLDRYFSAVMGVGGSSQACIRPKELICNAL